MGEVKCVVASQVRFNVPELIHIACLILADCLNYQPPELAGVQDFFSPPTLFDEANHILTFNWVGSSPIIRVNGF